MNATLKRTAALAVLALHALIAQAEDSSFRFGVISHAAGEAGLKSALKATDEDSLAFVVVNGLKNGNEDCGDTLYERRAGMLNEAQNGVIVSLAASDWAECRNEAGKSAAIGKLGRLRELLFADEFSLGATRLPVLRQSITPKFRGYAENARWEIGTIMFATINIPRNNNHYVSDAGRNSEFEDRTVANRDWLRRVFIHAEQKKAGGIVFFSDASPLTPAPAGRRDGYLELRRQIATLSAGFDGRVLLVYSDPSRTPSRTIRWKDRLGELNAGSGISTLAVNPDASYFSLAPASSGR